MNREDIKKRFGVDLKISERIAYSLYHLTNRDHMTSKCYGEASDLSNSVPDGIGERLVKVLDSFGVRGTVVKDIECGPVLVRINVVLPAGVKISAVDGLCDDIAMGLRVSKVSCTAIPERGVLAVDVPAETRKTVLPGNIKADTVGMTLPIELGVTVDGNGKAIDLAKAPHLLIAGATGSGKSVCINSIIASLIKNEDLRDFDMLLVDPKGVELSMYAFLPNCVNNRVLVSASESMEGLRWLVDEMERRYGLLAKYNVRNIGAYNEKLASVPLGPDSDAKMRYVVCVVDEFADLMMSSGAELTQLVQRLAQKSRAVGIHLVLATQRPSVKVITGDLKANLPSRIAFKVSSAIDSTTIIGHGGAERLLGLGDMILSANDVEERVHGVFFGDKAIEDILQYVWMNTVAGFDKRVDFQTGKAVADPLNVDLFNEIGCGRPISDPKFAEYEALRREYAVDGYGRLATLLMKFNDLSDDVVREYVTDRGLYGYYSPWKSLRVAK